jgi:hypothetical protein
VKAIPVVPSWESGGFAGRFDLRMSRYPYIGVAVRFHRFETRQLLTNAVMKGNDRACLNFTFWLVLITKGPCLCMALRDLVRGRGCKIPGTHNARQWLNLAK